MAYSESQKKATEKYIQNNLQSLRIWVKKGEVDAVKRAAAERGVSMAQFVIRAINAYAGKPIVTGKKEKDQ